jgi:hypothetical protein
MSSAAEWCARAEGAEARGSWTQPLSHWELTQTYEPSPPGLALRRMMGVGRRLESRSHTHAEPSRALEHARLPPNIAIHLGNARLPRLDGATLDFTECDTSRSRRQPVWAPGPWRRASRQSSCDFCVIRSSLRFVLVDCRGNGVRDYETATFHAKICRIGIVGDARKCVPRQADF